MLAGSHGEHTPRHLDQVRDRTCRAEVPAVPGRRPLLFLGNRSEAEGGSCVWGFASGERVPPREAARVSGVCDT